MIQPFELKKNLGGKSKAIKKKAFRKTKYFEIAPKIIPQNFVGRTLHKLQDTDECWEMWPCFTKIHQTEDMYAVSEVDRLCYARIYLMRRNWRNFAKIFCLPLPEDRLGKLRFSSYLKYGTVCLAYTDHDLLNSYLRFVHFVGNHTSAEMVPNCTIYPNLRSYNHRIESESTGWNGDICTESELSTFNYDLRLKTEVKETFI